MQSPRGPFAQAFRRLSRHALLAVIIGCSIVYSCGTSAQSAEVTVGQLSKEASAAQQSQQYSHAATLYRKILLLQPDFMEAEVNLGLMLHLSGDFKAAIATFQHVLAKHGDLFAPNLLTGLDYLKLDNPSLALPYLQKATDEKPDQAEARVGLANSYLQLKRYSEALEQFTRTTQLDGKNATAWYGLGATYLSMEKEMEPGLQHSQSPYRALLLGQSYLQQGKADKAIATLSAVVGSPHAVPCAHTYLGFAYLKASKLDDAAQQFQLDWNSRSGEGCLLAKLGLAALDANRNDTLNALRELNEAVESDMLFVQSNADLFLGDMVKAGADARARAILTMNQPSALPSAGTASAADSLKHGHYAACSSSLNDSFAKLSAPDLRSVALCSYYIGRDDIVMNATAKILKDAPADAEALYWRIQSAERLGLAALAEATNINPNSASLHALTGDMLREKGDLAEAADEYRKAIAVKPEFLSAHLGLARVLNSDHKSDDAEHELQYVLTANPDDPEANYLMGEILVNRSNLADALSFLLKALHVTPEELPYVHADLSQVYEDRGDLPQAIAELKQALSIDVDGSFYFRLGRLYARTGDRSAAAQALDQSAKLRRQADAAAQFVK